MRECVVRLLVAPEPLYMEKIIYVCDDGYANPEGAAKKKMVEELNALGAPHIPFPHLRCCCCEFWVFGSFFVVCGNATGILILFVSQCRCKGHCVPVLGSLPTLAGHHIVEHIRDKVWPAGNSVARTATLHSPAKRAFLLPCACSRPWWPRC